MQIDDNLLTKLEKLSSLKIAEEKREELITQLTQIVDFVEKLDELNLDGMEAMTSATKGGTPLREDKNIRTEVIDSVLEHAPRSLDNFFVVPKIIE